MKKKPENHQEGEPENTPATDTPQRPAVSAAETSAYELLAQCLTPDEARAVRRILYEWSQGQEDTFPFQLALLTRAQWKAAASSSLESRKVVEQFRAVVAESIRSISRVSAEQIADLAKVGDLGQILAKDVLALRKFTLEFAAHAETAILRYDQAAANFESAQLRYLDAKKASDNLAYCASLAFVTLLSSSLGFLACYCFVVR